MSLPWYVPAGILLVMNLAGFASMGLDKGRARRGARRIPERRLFLIAALGGALGSILGMRCFRHKTQHLAFRLGMPLILLCQLALGVWLLCLAPFVPFAPYPLLP